MNKDIKETKDTQWSQPFRYVVAFICFIAIVAFVFYARAAIRNLIIAAFVAYLFNPIVVYLSGHTKLTRTASVNIVYFSAVILLVGVPVSLAPIFYDEFRFVIEDLLDLSDQIALALSTPLQIGSLTFHLEEWAQSLSQAQNALLTPLPEEALKLLETTSVGVIWFLIILVSVYMFLAHWPQMREAMIDSVPAPYRDEVAELYNRVRRVWMAYLRGQIVLMLIVGVVFTVAWLILGIPGALVLGVLAGLFTLVPDVGPFLAMVLAAGVALLEGSTWIPLSNFWVTGIVIVVYLVLINAKNFFLRPIIMGRSVHMNEGLVFIAILIATILEGILGALLVVPLLASVVILSVYIQRKVLGLTPFKDDGSQRFAAPPEKIHPPRPMLTKRMIKKKEMEADKTAAADSPEVASPSPAESHIELDPDK
jgi:predicted PurR-regulated permease PerM